MTNNFYEEHKLVCEIKGTEYEGQWDVEKIMEENNLEVYLQSTF